MAVVTPEECRLLEEVLNRKREEEGQREMSGVTFIMLYEAIRNRASQNNTKGSAQGSTGNGECVVSRVMDDIDGAVGGATNSDESPEEALMSGMRHVLNIGAKSPPHEILDATWGRDRREADASCWCRGAEPTSDPTRTSSTNGIGTVLKAATGTDGINFIWNYFCSNEYKITFLMNNANGVQERSTQRMERSTVSDRIQESEATSNLQNSSQIPESFPGSANVDTNKIPPKSGMDGLKFVWNFFSKHLPEQIDMSLQRRNNEVRGSTQKLTPDEDFLLERLIKNSRGFDSSEDDDNVSIISSSCSSISFITASSITSGNRTVRPPTTPRHKPHGSREFRTSSPAFFFGSQSALTNCYLDTPSSDDETEETLNFEQGGICMLNWQRTSYSEGPL